MRYGGGPVNPHLTCAQQLARVPEGTEGTAAQGLEDRKRQPGKTGSRQPRASPQSVSKECGCHAPNVPRAATAVRHRAPGTRTAASSTCLQWPPTSSAVGAPPGTATGDTFSPTCLLPVPTFQHEHAEEGPGAGSLEQSLDNSKRLQPGPKYCHRASMPTTGPYEAWAPPQRLKNY